MSRSRAGAAEADVRSVATEPPEARGLARDEVRLMVARRRGLEHVAFRQLVDFLDPGDLLVVNISQTVPAALGARRDGEEIDVHLSATLDDGSWAVELRAPDRSGPLRDGRAREVIDLDGGGRIEIVSAYFGVEGRSRLLRVQPSIDRSVGDYLAAHGRPITYPYVHGEWPLSAYQTIFAREPGSAEMPSAARPFSHELVTELVTAGILMMPVVLHAGVSSLERDETPLPERFRVPEATARAVNEARARGSRVVAVGTTVARALETAAADGGLVRAASGWTDLVLGPHRAARVVTGLITGWHPPEASHRALLAAVGGDDVIDPAYAAAAREGYLSHEFGDSCLLLP